jgi:hypothetical protein
MKFLRVDGKLINLIIDNEVTNQKRQDNAQEMLTKESRDHQLRMLR